MVLQIWLWESSTVPDFYLRELKYSHCLSSFFLCFLGEWVRVGEGWCGVWNTPFLLYCYIVNAWNKISALTISQSITTPLFCKIRTVLLRLGTVPYTWASPQCMAQKSLWKAPLFRCSASSPGFLWESSTVSHNDWDWLETGFIRGASRTKRGFRRRRRLWRDKGHPGESSTALRERSIADRVRMRRQQNKTGMDIPPLIRYKKSVNVKYREVISKVLKKSWNSSSRS